MSSTNRNYIGNYMAIIPQPANFPIPHKASTRMPSGLNTSSSRQHNTAPSMLPIAGTLMIVGSAIYDALTKKKQEIVDILSTPQNIDTSDTSQDAGLEEGLFEFINGGVYAGPLTSVWVLTK